MLIIIQLPEPRHKWFGTDHIHTNREENTVPDSGDIALKLNWYEIQGTNLIGEETIKDLTVEDILKIFDAPFWNNLYHCWSVNEAQIAALTPHVTHPIDPSKYSYFIEMYKQKKTAS